MKIKSVRLERYKRFVDRTFDFTHPYSGKPLDLVVLVGENGCGKSSILQAIATTLGTATGQIDTPQKLTWTSFNFSGIDANHRGKSEITLDVTFTQDELTATQEYYEEYSSYNPLLEDVVWGLALKKDIKLVKPKILELSSLKLKFLADEELGTRYAIDYSDGISGNEFLGRKLAINLIYDKRKSSSTLLDHVGSVFWYAEDRTFYSINPSILNNLPSSDDSTIRRLITNWFAEDGQPRVKKFRDIYQKLFHNRQLSRIETYGTINPPVYFKNLDTEYEYELSELSGGERAILPIIIDFVQWDINNSVILIDELELHLHPPLQQALLSILDSLGKNNQFIITTHSDYVANLVPSSRIIRVDDVK